MELKGNDIKVLQALQSVHTLKSHPSTLWVMITSYKNNMTAFYDINDTQRKITVDYIKNHAYPLYRYEVFTWLPINQEAIDEATDKGETPPEPIKKYQVATQILEMIHKKDLLEEILGEIPAKIDDNELLIRVMKKVFEGYDEDAFKVHHMRQVWKWYQIIKQYADNLPPFVAPKQPAIESAPAIEELPKSE